MINNDFRPQVLPLQRPYPLVLFSGHVYAQVGAMVVLNPDKGIEPWPIVRNDVNGANMQILKSGSNKPNYVFFDLKICEGEEITWPKFHDLVDILSLKKDFSIDNFMYQLKRHKVTFSEMPLHVYIFIRLNSLGDPEMDKNNDFFYIDSYDIVLSEHNVSFKSKEYLSVKTEIINYKHILRHARFHVLYEHEDGVGIRLLEQVKVDIESATSESAFYNEVCKEEAMLNYIEIAQALHEFFPKGENTRLIAKKDILDIVCNKACIDPKHKEWVWRMLVDNGLVNSEMIEDYDDD